MFSYNNLLVMEISSVTDLLSYSECLAWLYSATSWFDCATQYAQY